METTGIIDRIEGDVAIVLVGESEDEMTIPVADLPQGAKEGSWLRLELEAGRIELDPQAEAEARERIEGKMDQLRSRGSRLKRSD